MNGKRKNLREILRRRIQIMRLRRLTFRRILALTGDLLRFRRSCQRPLHAKRQAQGEFHTLVIQSEHVPTDTEDPRESGWKKSRNKLPALCSKTTTNVVWRAVYSDLGCWKQCAGWFPVTLQLENRKFSICCFNARFNDFWRWSSLKLVTFLVLSFDDVG